MNTEDDIVRSLFPNPPWVTIVRTLWSGEIVTAKMPADEAVQALWLHPMNGIDFKSAHIRWGKELDCWSYSA